MAHGIVSNKVIQAYFRHMVDVAVILGADKNRAIKELAEVLDFEIQINKVSISSENEISICTLNFISRKFLKYFFENQRFFFPT